MRRFSPLLIFLTLVLPIVAGFHPLAQAAQNSGPIPIIAAGVPRPLAETHDYDRIFSELVASGFTVFLPTFQYQESPEALSYGYELDFIPPCDPNAPVFVALREHHMKLLIPAQLLYPADDFPTLEDDPLAALIACAGQDSIAGVLSIDEPAAHITDPSDPYGLVEAIYTRVKTIAPDLPVLMVHLPLISIVPEGDSFRSTTKDEMQAYMDEVTNFSQYADVIGFDVYPIPAEAAYLTAPSEPVQPLDAIVPLDYQTALPAYLDWLRDLGKPYFLALQAFPYERLWNIPNTPRYPSEVELRDMGCIAIAGGSVTLAWWGQGLLTDEDADFWATFSRVNLQLATNAADYCR